MNKAHPFACVALLLASTAAASEGEEALAPRKLVVLDLKPGSVAPATAATLTSLVSVSAGRAEGFEVLTSADLREMLDLEAQKQTLGCDDESSCLSEVAGAMGADLVLYGDCGQLGDVLIVNLHVFDAKNARAVGRETLRTSDPATLPDAIDGAVARLLGVPASHQTDGLARSSGEPLSWLPPTALVAAGVGGLVLLGGLTGIALGASAFADYEADRAALEAFAAEHPSPEGAVLDEGAALAAAAEEKRLTFNQWGGAALVGGGAATLVGALGAIAGAGAAAFFYLAPEQE